MKKEDQGIGGRDQTRHAAPGTRHPKPILHPFFFGLTPILFLFVYNSRKFAISPEELLLPSVLTVAALLLVWLLLALLFRAIHHSDRADSTRSGIVASLLVFLFFSFGHVAKVLRVSSGPLLIIAGVVLAIVGALVVEARRSFQDLTSVLNVVSLAMVVTTIVTGLPSFFNLKRSAAQPQLGTRDSQIARHPSPVTPRHSASRYPDIYYIILDMYARADVMAADYGHDNSDFTTFLKQQGFYVPDHSLSNYAQTYLSLASSLNFSYLDSTEGPTSLDQTPLIQMIGHSRLAEFLKTRGYTIVTYSSGYTGTDIADADVRIAPRWALSEFQDLLLTTTVLPALLGSRLGVLQDESHRQRILSILRTIPAVASHVPNTRHPTRNAQSRPPVFVFAHVICPHPPFVFDARGNRPDIIPYLRINQTGTTRQVSRQLLKEWFRDNYAPQVTYLNQLLETTVRQILARSPNPPIIILQGDHGPGQIANDAGLARDAMVKRHAILDAIYEPAGIPDRDSGNLQSSVAPAFSLFYDSITPVNTFRVLLTQYLDTSLALLPDRSYYSTLQAPYSFTEVTPTRGK